MQYKENITENNKNIRNKTNKTKWFVYKKKVKNDIHNQDEVYVLFLFTFLRNFYNVIETSFIDTKNRSIR